MMSVEIVGGNPLYGKVAISGSKNAGLAMLSSCILTEEPVTLRNVPDVSDIKLMKQLLRGLGAEVALEGAADIDHGSSNCSVTVCARNISSHIAPQELVSKMRASVLLLGPLLTKFGHAQVGLPGGCAIGARPIDIHLKGLIAMGAVIEFKDGYIHATAPEGLKGAEISFHTPSVGATENIAAAATLARGVTVMHNVAREPEVVNFLKLLEAMGADIDGIGTHTLRIRGVGKLHGATLSVIGDRIEAGTYAIAAGITGGSIDLSGIDCAIIDDFLPHLVQCGMLVEPNDHGVRFTANGPLLPHNIETGEYPGFPTDLQAQMMALLCHVDNGSSSVKETIYENRFMHVAELNKMGANISVEGNMASISPALSIPDGIITLQATDLRASASLVLFGLFRKAHCVIKEIHHLQRGYDNLFSKLIRCGADIRVG